MKWYNGNETGQIPGAFPEKWWEGAALFLAVLNYWHFTGDDTYNDQLSVGLEFQGGPNGDYWTSNYSRFLGNDDQMFWGLAAIQAAELKLPDVPDGNSWLSLAQGVFNDQKDRWDTTACGGGLRWQVYVYQSGYVMKNSVSNGGFFQLAARLYRYTGNSEYKDWAEKVWDWSASSPLLNNKTWNVADSTNMDDNCATAGNIQWTYNYGVYLGGAAYMYNKKWLDAVNGLLKRSFQNFFLAEHGFVMEDITCEPREICNNNEILFKGLFSSWLAYTALLVPSTYDTIMPKLESSIQAAAKSCTGNNNNTCGVRWYQSKWDGWTGMEEQISASNIFSCYLIKYEKDGKGPVTSTTGGNSESDPNAGEESGSSSEDKLKPITTGDRAGAGILTFVFVAGWAGLMSFMFLGG
ncbi:hypothetical protein N7532_012012 [Penicillium argentinense]|uniref:Mannan endo-1,6-alpha-mannosidase n=1 Tax=Penicillium argentinense TaxID=1131581 RepID=A0A9W9EJJ0_9EURO|nr:uncharacterized protein N7532_012012 [Penicillium argentinense]KAJ5082969.1 hypothetical protein N7532_012012 [Penicillium argentinense]